MRRVDSVAAAEIVIDRGWQVFFVSSDKVPLRGTHGHLDATSDRDVMRSMARRGQVILPAIAPRPDEVVVDIDPRNGGTAESVGLEGREADAVSRSRGWHHFFRNDGLRTQNGVLPGIDLKSAGGYVVAWQPEALPWRDELQQIPPETLAILRAAQSTRRSTAAEDEDVVWPNGVRDDRLFRYLCRLRNAGMDAAGLRAEAVRKNAVACDPPLPDEQALAKAEGAARYPVGEAWPEVVVTHIRGARGGLVGGLRR
jgi:hypothetical protein